MNERLYVWDRRPGTWGGEPPWPSIVCRCYMNSWRRALTVEHGYRFYVHGDGNFLEESNEESGCFSPQSTVVYSSIEVLR